MGDRGVIGINQDDGNTVYLYSHWGGSELPSDLQICLARRERWNDPTYLGRMVLETMIPSNQKSNALGFGITTTVPADIEHPVLTVGSGHVKLWAIPSWNSDGELKVQLASWTIEEYLELESPDHVVDGYTRSRQ